MKFAIRDALWLTLVVAVGSAWWAQHELIRYDYDNFIREHINWKWIQGDHFLGRPLVAPDRTEPRPMPFGTVVGLMILSAALGVGIGVSVRRLRLPPAEIDPSRQ